MPPRASERSKEVGPRLRVVVVAVLEGHVTREGVEILEELAELHEAIEVLVLLLEQRVVLWFAH